MHSCRDGTGDVIAKSVLIRVMLFLIIVALISSYTIVVLVSAFINLFRYNLCSTLLFFLQVDSKSFELDLSLNGTTEEVFYGNLSAAIITDAESQSEEESPGASEESPEFSSVDNSSLIFDGERVHNENLKFTVRHFFQSSLWRSKKAFESTHHIIHDWGKNV